MIPYGRHDVDEADIEAVREVLTSDRLTQGPAVERFERDLTSLTGAAEAVAVNSATSALHIACLALDLGPGERLWTVPNTYVASANCALYCGADVDFVDIDPTRLNMSAPSLAERLEAARRDNRLPKVVVPVHFAGLTCDMRAIHELSQRYGFRIVEDASHAIGGAYDGGPVGDCRYSDITVFSFHAVKVVTTGEGGAAMTNDPALAERMRRLRSHGVTRDESLMRGQSDGPWYYQQIDLGFNYRMTDVQAALGSSQLQRLQAMVDRREALADRYDRLLAGISVTTPARARDTRSAWHLYVVQLAEGANRDRRSVFEELQQAGVGVNVHYIPVHLQPYYAGLGFRPGDFPNAEAYYAKALTLPLFPRMSEADQDHVVTSLTAALA
jgi:UDP-4-amino-4,6-dideoxy-N-acetyl-beta-L-altrosamine transaminase